MNDTIKEFADILNKIPFNRTIGLTMDTVEEELVTLRFAMKETLIGNFFHGILHGGVTSAVLDMAGGAAAMIAALKKHPDKSIDELSSVLEKSSTIDLHINYIKPGKGTHFTAKARVVHSGNKITFAEMKMFNHEGVLIATGTGTYLI